MDPRALERPRRRVAALERRLAQRAPPEAAWLELERGVDRRLLAWHAARTELCGLALDRRRR
jgi:hypothetical protein